MRKSSLLFAFAFAVSSSFSSSSTFARKASFSAFKSLITASREAVSTTSALASPFSVSASLLSVMVGSPSTSSTFSTMTPSSTTITLPSGIGCSPFGCALSPTCGAPSSRSIVSVAPVAVCSSMSSAGRVSVSSIVPKPAFASNRCNQFFLTSTLSILSLSFIWLIMLSVAFALALAGSINEPINPSSIARSAVMYLSSFISACISSRLHPHRSTYRFTMRSCSARIELSSCASRSAVKHSSCGITKGLCTSIRALRYALRCSRGAASMMIVAILAALPSIVVHISLPVARNLS